MANTPNPDAAQAWGRLSQGPAPLPVPRFPPLPQRLRKIVPEMAQWEQQLEVWRQALITSLQGPQTFD
jgi:hypothetical protein